MITADYTEKEYGEGLSGYGSHFPFTGDTNDIIRWSFLSLVSLAVIVVINKKRKY